ncbi:hypothetical protein [Maritimibacter sp. UBA3975]|uniref:hypothetical protein n=1 Tax=Maritimibacter sp. UBA3975 TaxID=1946833 RepID=UPI000C0948CA|nr:hypothetical protein [Maritimibacter sp. UBA3975]MAM59947.1 hypothetical protein [Maritimibacter sp.]
MISFNDIIDEACPAAVQAERQGRLPTRMFVHPVIFNGISEIRRDEIANGFPLILLGMFLEVDPDLPRDGFRFER